MRRRCTLAWAALAAFACGGGDGGDAPSAERERSPTASAAPSSASSALAAASAPGAGAVVSAPSAAGLVGPPPPSASTVAEASSSSSAPPPEPWPPPILVPVEPAPLPALVAHEPGVCPGDTVAIDGFCIDLFEAPNRRDALPLAFQTAKEGEAWCRAAGKRLCTEAEWLRTCRGREGRPYPYGASPRRGFCTDDKEWRVPAWSVLDGYPSTASFVVAAKLYQADPSGSRATCASEEGVMDLTGNVSEWVVRSLPNSRNYNYVLKGCYWSGCYDHQTPSCAFVNPSHPGDFRSYDSGFRCCLTP